MAIKAPRDGYQLEGSGPAAYERYLVPAFFTACARLLLEAVEPAPGEQLLDVATGTGVVARAAAGRIGQQGSVVGVDINEAMLSVARAESNGTPVSYLAADAAALPLPDGAFDVVTCQHGIQFFARPDAALREMRRVLAPGGRIGLAAWRSLAFNPLFARIVDILDRHLGAEAADSLREPFNGPSGEELRSMAADAGFAGPTVRIGIVPAHFPSGREAFRRLCATTLAKAIAGVDPARREVIERDVSLTLAAYADDEGLRHPMETWIVSARD